MKKNLMKKKMNKGEVVIGAIIQEPTIQIAEILGILGYDFLLIDCEHSSMNLESVARLILAAELRGMTPLVRPPQNEEAIIAPYLDAGAMGIVIAGLDSVEDAQKAVRAVKYPPKGERGLSAVRPADYGLSGPMGEYIKMANSETIVMGIVESREGVESIDEILSVKGLDGLNIGTNDLSNTLGVPGQTDHPLVLEAMDKILAAGKKAGKPIGGPVRKGEAPKQIIEKGFRILATAVPLLIASAGKKFLEDARG